MPREIAHWNLVQLGAEELRRSGSREIANVLESHRGACFLGAMAPDVPYYYRFGGTVFQQAAERIHGKDGEDTLTAVREFAAHLAEKSKAEREYLAAFILGFITHCVMDWHFHPLVYYLTGDYYHADSEKRRRAQGYHRAFEVYLDAWFYENGVSLWNKGSVNRAIKEERARFASLSSLLESSPVCADNAGGSRAADMWLQGYRDMGVIQRLCLSAPVGYAFRWANTLSGKRLAPYAAMAKAGRWAMYAPFDKPIRYRNPLSGIEHETRIDALRDEAVREFAEIAAQLEPIWLGSDSDSASVLEEVKGKSLNMGLPEVKTADAEYYAEQPPEFLRNE